MKVSYLVMFQTLAHTVFSMSPPVVLKPHEMQCLMRLGSQKEQVDIDLVDDDEAPCDALQRMMIGDVRPQDPSNQPQKTSLNDTTPPTQGLDQDNHEEDVKSNDQNQEESNDQGGDEDNEEAPPHPRVH
jgi:hypothetical protein